MRSVEPTLPVFNFWDWCEQCGWFRIQEEGSACIAVHECPPTISPEADHPKHVLRTAGTTIDRDWWLHLGYL